MKLEYSCKAECSALFTYVIKNQIGDDNLYLDIINTVNDIQNTMASYMLKYGAYKELT